MLSPTSLLRPGEGADVLSLFTMQASSAVAQCQTQPAPLPSAIERATATSQLHFRPADSSHSRRQAAAAAASTAANRRRGAQEQGAQQWRHKRTASSNKENDSAMPSQLPASHSTKAIPPSITVRQRRPLTHIHPIPSPHSLASLQSQQQPAATAATVQPPLPPASSLTASRRQWSKSASASVLPPVASLANDSFLILEDDILLLSPIPACKGRTEREELAEAANMEQAEGGEMAEGVKVRMIRELQREARTLQRERDGSRQEAAQQLQTAQAQLSALRDELQQQQVKAATADNELHRLHDRLQAMEAKAAESRRSRLQLLTQLMDARGSIRVLCRIRPPAAAAASSCFSISVSSDSLSQVLQLQPPPAVSVTGQLLPAAPLSFTFDSVLPACASQSEVWRELSPLVDGVLEAGVSATVCLYGQTSSGKSYTMWGHGGDGSPTDGLVGRTLHRLWEEAETRQQDDSNSDQRIVRVSAVEIHNEEVVDLLQRQRVSTDVTVDASSGASFVRAVNAASLRCLLSHAYSERHLASTLRNASSSRAHTVLRLSLASASLSLIDLAGSERFSSSSSAGLCSETRSINSSLSALLSTLTALHARAAYVPYRDSALTSLMAPALRGDGRLAFVCCVSADSACEAETVQTLRFGEKVRGVERRGGGRVVKEKARKADETDRTAAAAAGGGAAGVPVLVGNIIKRQRKL